MDFLKSVWDIATKPDVILAGLSIIGGLKLLSKYTKTEVDDKVLAVLEWPFKKLSEKFGK